MTADRYSISATERLPADGKSHPVSAGDRLITATAQVLMTMPNVEATIQPHELGTLVKRTPTRANWRTAIGAEDSSPDNRVEGVDGLVALAAAKPK
jgi:hypothetical protein